jgi:hypothetical protein
MTSYNLVAERMHADTKMTHSTPFTIVELSTKIGLSILLEGSLDLRTGSKESGLAPPAYMAKSRKRSANYPISSLLPSLLSSSQ